MTSSGGQDTTLTVFLGTLSEGLSQDLDILLAAVEKLDKGKNCFVFVNHFCQLHSIYIYNRSTL